MKTLRARVTLFVVLTLASRASALCSSVPANTNLGSGKAGEIKMTTPSGTNTFNKLMYCDGTNWKDFGGSPTATACTKNGAITISSGEVAYCNSTLLWQFDSGSTTNGTCSKSGETRWNSTQLEFCNGTNWRVVSADTTPDSLSDVTLTNQNIEIQEARYFPLTGFTSGSATVTFTDGGGTCVSMSARVCSDNSACTSAIGSTLSANGTLTVYNGSYLRLAGLSSTQATTTCGFNVSLGSSSFNYTWTTTASDTAPTIQSLTALIGQAASTLVTSNIVKVYAHTGVTISIADNGTGGSPEFRVCSDAACSTVDVTWGTASQTLTNPKYIQLRTTTGATAYDWKQVVVTAGTTTARWDVTTSTCPIFIPALAAGATQTCTCPSTVTGMSYLAYGNLNYKETTSETCMAAVHAGALTSGVGGSVTLKGTSAGTPSGTCPSFTASTRNGITTGSASSGASVYFPGFGTDTCN